MLDIGERTLYRKIQDWKQQDRIRQALAEHRGDVAAVAKALKMSEADLRQEIKKYGLAEG
jgi:DNA-binding NtrC family response regulator